MTFQIVALKLHAHKLPNRPICTAVGEKHWELMIWCWLPAPQLQPMACEVVMAMDTFFSVGANSVGTLSEGLGKTVLFFSLRCPSNYIFIGLSGLGCARTTHNSNGGKSAQWCTSVVGDAIYRIRSNSAGLCRNLPEISIPEHFASTKANKSKRLGRRSENSASDRPTCTTN